MTEVALELVTTGYIPVVIQPTSTDFTVLQGGGSICGWSLRDVAATQANQTSGNVVAPGAGTTIASLTGLAAGTYKVSWTVGLQGAAAAADANNFELFDTAGNVIASVNPGAAGEYAQLQVELTVAAGATIGVKAIGAGTAGITYSADIVLAVVGETETVIEFQDAGNPVAEVSFATFKSSTEWFGYPGVRMNANLVLHIISGTVTGAVYISPSYSSQ
jgi:hypothetical protein